MLSSRHGRYTVMAYIVIAQDVIVSSWQVYSYGLFSYGPRCYRLVLVMAEPLYAMEAAANRARQQSGQVPLRQQTFVHGKDTGAQRLHCYRRACRRVRSRPRLLHRAQESRRIAADLGAHDANPRVSPFLAPAPAVM